MLSTLLFPYSSSSMFCFAAYRCFIKNLYMFSSVLPEFSVALRMSP